MLNDFKQVLANIGLKENEIPVYLACLQSEGGLQIQEIANKTGIKRSTVNLILERLVKGGFANYHLEGKRRIFKAEAPEHTLFGLQEKINDFQGVLPFLRKQSKDEIISKVRFYEGVEGIKEIYADIILTMKIKPLPEREILEIASGEDIFQMMPDQDKVFINKRIKEQIFLRWLAPKNDKVAITLTKTAKQEHRDIRFFDGEKYSFHIDAMVYGNKLTFISTHKNPAGIIMENKEISASFRSIFNLLWNFLSK